MEESILNSYQTAFQEALLACQNLNDVEGVRVKFLGRKAELATWMAGLKSMSDQDKRVWGPLLNAFKLRLEQQLADVEKTVAQKVLAANQRDIDFSLYRSSATSKGNKHFLSKFIEEIENIFLDLGYRIFQGPEVELEDYNFTKLNIAQDHPAKEMFDTLWLTKPGMLLRTHTSPVQIRSVVEHGVPIAGICPGRVFRHEAIDATHETAFLQCEGIFIDKGIHMGHLLGTAELVLKRLFATDALEIRVRPGFFPFVEPGVEIDMACIFCQNKNGCSVCKKSGWIEVFPGGMIHSNVLKNMGVDPDQYSGFAFGFGIERLAMLRHRINDIRLFRDNDLRFLKQF